MSIKVTLDGTPLEGATVSLVEIAGTGKTAVGMTTASGFAPMKSTEGWEGVFPGEYTVTIKKTQYSTSSTPPGGGDGDRSGEDGEYAVSTELLPEIYGNSRTSGLKVTQEKKKGAFTFDISANP